MRSPLPAVLLLVGSVAVAQTPPAAPDRNTVTAEATELVRARPDQAKLYFTVLVKNPDAATSVDENAEQAKQFFAAIEKLQLKGVKAVGQPQRVSRVESQNRIGNNNAFIPEFHAARGVVVSVAAADADELATLVEKVQQEAAKLGVGGEAGGATYNGFGYERNAAVRIAYSLKGGWDDLVVPALGTATKKAVARAEAMASGAGLKLGEVVSISEPLTSIGSQTIYNYANSGIGMSGGSSPGVAADAQDEFVDGELVRRVRVRVVVEVKK